MVLSQSVTTVTDTSSGYYTTTFSSTTTSTVLSSAPFTVSGKSGSSCYYAYFTWNSTGYEGKEILGSWTSSVKMEFWIMTPLQFSDWRGSTGSSCYAIPGSGLVSAIDTTSYSIDWVVPTIGGRYYFVFYNIYATDATINFSLWTMSQVAVTAQATTMIIGTETRTSTPVAVSQTTAIQTTSSAQTSSPIMLAGSLLYVVIVVVLLVFAVIAAVVLRRRTPKPPTPQVAKGKEIAGKTFCINCGAELHANSKFCDKCGSAQ